MQLTSNDKEKITEWLKEKCGAMRCFCCGSNVFQLLDIATLPIGIDIHTTRFLYATGIPQILIACSNCGNMVAFNAAIMGFKPGEPKSKD